MSYPRSSQLTPKVANAPRTRSSDDREVWWISPIEPLRDELVAFGKKSVQWDGRACQLDVVDATADKGAHPPGHGVGQDLVSCRSGRAWATARWTARTARAEPRCASDRRRRPRTRRPRSPA